MTATETYNAALLSREDLCSDLAVFCVSFDDGAVPDFEPGQHTQLGIVLTPEEDEAAARKGKPRLARRTYSIASSPRTREYLEFYAVHVPGGRFTSHLWSLRPGDPLFLDRRITGKMTLDAVPAGADVVAVATGTGVAPFMSMLRTYAGMGRWRRFVLIHGTRLTAHLGYRGELERIAEADASVVYLPTVTREPSESRWEGLRGRVQALLEPAAFERATGVALSPAACHVMLCGNPDMVDTCEVQLVGQGFKVRDREHPQGNVHFERYW